MTYILVTPAKNEAANLPALIESVVAQTVRPMLWVIVDDCSTDRTGEILADAAGVHDWILPTRYSWDLDWQERGVGIEYHISQVLHDGFREALERCQARGLPYSYLGVLDADMSLDPTFYEKLLAAFETDNSLGLASGVVLSRAEDRLVYEIVRSDIPRGGCRLWRRKCFEETGGIPLTSGWDSVSGIRARVAGWTCRVVSDAEAVQSRRTTTGANPRAGLRRKAEVAHYLDLHPLLVLAHAGAFTVRTKGTGGAVYLWEYLKRCVRHQHRIEDEQVRQYYQSERLREYWRFLVARALRREPPFTFLGGPSSEVSGPIGGE